MQTASNLELTLSNNVRPLPAATPPPPLLSLSQAIAMDIETANRLYAKHLNPGLLEVFRLLGLAEMDIVSAEGAEIKLRDGRTIIDFSSSIGVVGLGHNHPRILAAERLCHEGKLIDAIKVAPHKLQAALAFNLCAMLPASLRHCFLTVSGAEAVEAAMKVCERAQGSAKTKFITTTGSFHGKTHGALAVTTSGGFQRGFLLGVPKEHVIEVPYGRIEAIKDAIRQNTTPQGRNSIIAMLVEPIQGQGVTCPPDGYLEDVASVCRENGILTIFDEVKSSMGRTGTFCAFQRESAVPDVVTISKSLGGGKRAVGAMICTVDVYQRAYAKRSDSALHTTTFGGLGESCAVAIEALNILVDENLIEGAKEKGEYLRRRLEELKGRYPDQIADLHGRGLFQGVQFQFSRNLWGTLDSLMIAAVVRELYEVHSIIAHFSGSHPNILHIMPPLIVRQEHLDQFVEALDRILAKGLLRVVGRFVNNAVLRGAV